MSSLSEFAKQLSYTQYYFRVIGLMKRLKMDNYFRPILDIKEKYPKFLKEERSLPANFSEN